MSTTSVLKKSLLMHDQAEEMLCGKKLAFLVGSPRSGTTWLQLLLTRPPSVVTTPETNLFTNFLRSTLDHWNDLRSTGEAGLAALLSDEEFRDLLRTVSGFVFAKIAQRKPSATVVLEKTASHVRYWREILDLWPDAHFIHLIRDPRSVVASVRAASRSWAPQLSSGFSRDAETWVRDVTDGRQISSATPNYQEVLYHELISDGPNVLMRLLSGLGVRSCLDECWQYVDECKIENLKAGKLDGGFLHLTKVAEASTPGFFRKGATDSWRTELSAWEIALVEHVAGPLMSKLGFKPVNDTKAMSVLVDMAWTARGAARAAKRRLRRPAQRR